jgi:hypothetical protein
LTDRHVRQPKADRHSSIDSETTKRLQLSNNVILSSLAYIELLSLPCRDKPPIVPDFCVSNVCIHAQQRTLTRSVSNQSMYLPALPKTCQHPSRTTPLHRICGKVTTGYGCGMDARVLEFLPKVSIILEFPCRPPPHAFTVPSVLSRRSLQPRVVVCRVPDLVRSLSRGSTAVAAAVGTHVTDRQRQQLPHKKTITCERDSRPILTTHPVLLAIKAQHGIVTQLHRNEGRKNR